LTIRDRVHQYIAETCYLGDGVTLDDDLSLIDSGIVDSTGMLDVILFLEGAFAISIEDRDTVPENLETVGRIAAFVQRKLDAA
jgi:acyl carrier protein